MSISAGEIVFVGKGNPEPSKFAIINKDLAISKDDMGPFMEQFILNEFGLFKPKVLLSVTGGAQDFNMLTSKLEQVFNRGLVRAAKNTSAWIITGGLDAGVMRFVGDSIRDQDVMEVPCIGVASKKKVSNHDTLVQGQRNLYSQQKPNDDVSAALNPNHTHFILVDSPKATWGEEITFRTSLEDFISQTWGVPLVLVVVNGGPGTFQTVAEGLERGFPTIIVEGSGRAADAIAARVRALRNPKTDISEWENLIKNQKPENKEKLIAHMENILRNVKQITLFNPNEDATSDMDMTILKAILEGPGHTSFVNKLFLGVEWGRADIIRDLLEKHSDKESSEAKVEALNKALQMSLEQDRPDIFSLLIEKGADKSKVVISRLYNEQSVQYLLERLIPFVGLSGKKVTHEESELGSIYPDRANKMTLHRSDSISMIDIAKTAMAKISDMYVKILVDDHVTFTDLLVWSIMVDRHDLAKEIWKQTELPVHAGLVACHLYGALGEWFPGEDTYDDNAEWFEKQTIRVLEDLEYEDAKAVLEHKSKELDFRNPLQIAEIADAKEFVSQQYVQRFLDELLYTNSHGKLPVGYSVWSVFFLLIFPFFSKMFIPNRADTPNYYVYTLPISKFVTSTTCYIGFLALISVVLVQLGDVWQIDGSIVACKYCFFASEYLLWFWVAAFLWEELQQFLEDDGYFTRISNQMDTFIMFLLISHVGLRITTRITESSLAFDLCVYSLIFATIFAYLRLMNVFAFSQTLGPLFFVIVRLIKDVVKWMFIFAVFLISFQLGVMALTDQARDQPWQAYPNGTFAVTFFAIIGEYSYAMETMDKTPIGVALLAIYALVSQIMLVNLLIAMMGDTYGDVKDNSIQEWRYYRYILIYDYKASSAYPPPFNFIVGPFVFISEKMKQGKAANYFAIKEESYQSSSNTDTNIADAAEKNMIKRLKISKEKILEEDEVNESISMKSLSMTIREHLRLMSNQRDSDRLFLEDNLKTMQAALDDMKKQLEKIAPENK